MSVPSLTSTSSGPSRATQLASATAHLGTVSSTFRAYYSHQMAKRLSTQPHCALALASSTLVRAFRVGSLTGLQESQIKTRGIVVGDVLRKAVSKTVVKSHKQRILEALGPLQWGAGVPGGVEELVHLIRLLIFGPLIRSPPSTP